MEQRELPLMGRIEGRPSVVPLQYVTACKTFREAVRVAFSLKQRAEGWTNAELARAAKLTPQHVSDYLAKDDKPGRRDLPAQKVAEFERAVGNTLVSQWLAAQVQLTVLEELQATRAAA